MLSLLWLLACSATTEPVVDRAGEPGIMAERSGPGVAIEVIRVGAGSSHIEARPADGPTYVLVEAKGNPDRPALSPDGRHLAYVSGVTGIASVWLVEVRPDATPKQLTNVGLDKARIPGQAPPGFVPPPWDDSLRFDGDALVWTGPDGPHRVAWR